MEEVYTQKLDADPTKWISLFLYTDVENMADFRESVLAGDLDCSILKASLVIDTLQVVVAANKAVMRKKLNMLITKSVFTEIIYLMSSSDSITASLNQFGAQDDDRNMVVVLINNQKKNKIAKKMHKYIEGQLTSFSRLKEFHDMALIKKVYKISDTELEVSTLLDSVISRIGGSYPIKTK